MVILNAAIVDTDAASREKIIKMLRNVRGIDAVIGCGNRKEYLGELQKGTINITFIRVGSPGLQGIALAKESLELRPEVRVVFVVGDRSYAVSAFDAGAWGYLTLPLEQGCLDEAVHNIIRRSQQNNSISDVHGNAGYTAELI